MIARCKWSMFTLFLHILTPFLQITFDSAQPTGTSTLTFATVALTDAGSYKCQATYVVNDTPVVRSSNTGELYIRGTF